MKRLFFTVLLIVGFASIAFAQNKIEGIGKFKLGATTNEIKKILVEATKDLLKNPEFSEIPIVSNERDKGINFCVQLCQNPDSTFSDAPLDKNAEIFYIRMYRIVDKIAIYDVYLHFYNDSLYCITSAFTDNLIDAFKLKYGNPKEERKETPKEYINSLGLTTMKADIDESWEWNTGIPFISCRAVRKIYYTNEGTPSVFALFSIWMPEIESKVVQAEQKIKEHLIDKERMNKLKKLEGL